MLGPAMSELFMQFIARVYCDITDSKLAIFSKLKYITAPKSSVFRKSFKAEYKGGFIVPAKTFDNVTGPFPIGFLTWDFEYKNDVKDITCDVFDEKGIPNGTKTFVDGYVVYINNWLKKYYGNKDERIATLGFVGNDFQNQKFCFLTVNGRGHHENYVTQKNIAPFLIYFTVRLCFEQTWLNDRDQFLYPNDDYKTDTEFQNNCLVFTLFHGQNRISSHDGVNHWIPFTEKELGAREKFESNFMSNFIADKKFSAEATAVLDAGRELWRYYHSKIKGNLTVSHNASFYDIREYFQGRKESGNMNTKSTDETYTTLIATCAKN
jgi:hypothetical protein